MFFSVITKNFKRWNEVFRIKTLMLWGFTEKPKFYWVHEKTNIKALPRKGGLGQFADLTGGLSKNEGGCFGGDLIPQCTLC